MEVLDGDKYRAIRFRIKDRKQEIIRDRIEIAECVLTIGAIDDITLVHVVGWSESSICILETWIHLD